MLPFGSFFEELDFDDEPPARERRGPRFGRREPSEDDTRGGGGGGGGGGTGDFYDDPPRRGRIEFRRIAVVVAALVVLGIFGYWYVQRCQRSQEVDAYRGYVASVNQQTTRANAIASALRAALLKPTQTKEGLVAAFAAAAAGEQRVVTAVSALSGPDQLGVLQAQLLEAQQLRLNGLQGMAQNLPAAFAAFDTKALTIAPDRVARVSQLLHRVLAGDVVFSDAFAEPARRVLDARGITGSPIAPSQFVTAPILPYALPDRLADRLSAIMAGALPTKSGSGSGTKRRGTGITAVIVDGVTMVAGQVNEVTGRTAGSDVIVVKVNNGGAYQETQVGVHVLMDSQPQGKAQSILVFDPGKTETLTFPIKPLYAQNQTIKVTVDPVPGETSTLNNVATYTVSFKLGG
jgi:hypothetical protein